MANEYTFKVYPSGLSREVFRTIIVSGEDTLDDLCIHILQAYDFIHEHLYEFLMDDKLGGGRVYQVRSAWDDPFMDDEPTADTTDIKLDKLNLQKGQNFTLHYDFGDDWLFVIHVQKISPKATMETPAVIKAKGEIAQYPNWEDDDFEGEELDEDDIIAIRIK